MPVLPRMYQGVRRCPNGNIRSTRTRSPVLKRAGALATAGPVATGSDVTPVVARFDIRNLSSQLLDADDASLDQRLRNGMDPALVVAHLVVGVGADRLDILAQLVDRHQLAVFAGEQNQQSVDTLFPHRVVVLGTLHSARRLAAHIVMTARGNRIGHHPIIASRMRPYTVPAASAPATPAEGGCYSHCQRAGMPGLAGGAAAAGGDDEEAGGAAGAAAGGAPAAGAGGAG